MPYQGVIFNPYSHKFLNGIYTHALTLVMPSQALNMPMYQCPCNNDITHTSCTQVPYDPDKRVAWGIESQNGEKVNLFP